MPGVRHLTADKVPPAWIGQHVEFTYCGAVVSGTLGDAAVRTPKGEDGPILSVVLFVAGDVYELPPDACVTQGSMSGLA